MSSLLFCIAILIKICFSQNTTYDPWIGSINDTVYYPLPSTSITNDSLINEAFPAPWLFAMVLTGFLGILVVGGLGIHTTYHLYADNIAQGFARYLYMFMFVFYTLTCIGYALFRIDLILPMGSSIDCKVGYFWTTNCVFLSKVSLFAIFLFRIDLAFHTSALGYSRKFLTVITCLYGGGISLLNGYFIYFTWDLVKYIKDSYEVFGSQLTIGMCTTGVVADPNYTNVLGSIALGDATFSIFVCALFVYKLNKVVKLTQHDKTVKASSADKKRHNKLVKVMKKQTILVLFAVITSFLVLGVGAVFTGFSLLIPLDAMANSFAVWLMFTFADGIWNKILHTCCCCCYCCLNKEDFLITMQSLSRRMSTRSSIRATSLPTDHKTTKNIPLVSIKDRNSQKMNDITIKFDNNLKSKDLDFKININKKTNHELVEDKSIQSNSYDKSHDHDGSQIVSDSEKTPRDDDEPTID